MINRAVRILPFPPTSVYTLEVVAQIKAIPHEDIKYSDSEIEWMKRALQNLDYMLAQAKRFCLDDSIEHINLRREWIEKTLASL